VTSFKPVKTDETEAFFRAFKNDAKVDAAGYDVVAFGDSAAMADELLALVLTSIKRATASLARDYAGFGGEGREPLPKVGDIVVVVDGRNKPRCVWRTTEIEVKPLVAVDDAFAFDEGEGNQTRDGWLADHRGYFSRQAAREGFDFDDQIATVFERFTIIWPRLFADDWKGPRLM
jgi:uncharacterized protein YhfF